MLQFIIFCGDYFYYYMANSYRVEILPYSSLSLRKTKHAIWQIGTNKYLLNETLDFWKQWKKYAENSFTASLYLQVMHYNKTFLPHDCNFRPWIHNLFLYGIIDLKISITTNFFGVAMQILSTSARSYAFNPWIADTFT